MLFGGLVPHEYCCDGYTWRTYIVCVCLSQHFFQIEKSGEQKSRPKIKNSRWMESGETFCKISVTEVYSEKIPGFASQKTKQKTFDSFSSLKHVFVFYASYLVQSVLKKTWLSSEIPKWIPRKTRFLFWWDSHIQLKESQPGLVLKN